MPDIRQANILGCYAQTELGHGSDVASLETTATLDKATDEFVINSATPTSTKMWPGDLGRFTTHAVVHARLIVDGKFHGVHPFLVQLRDLETFRHLKGVKTGDLGPKFGYPTKDNGWARFDQVRIPRTNLLMGFIEVTKDGQVVPKGDLRVLYTTMMYIRMLLIKDMGVFVMPSVLVGLRYGVIRRQFKTYHGKKEERKLMDYQTHQHVFGSLISRGIVYTISGFYVRDMFKQMMDAIRVNNFQLMDSMHHILAGFKAVFTEECVKMIEQSRMACGGAGFGSFSGFTDAFQNFSPIPTYEGDNTVMLQQACKYLFKLVKQSAKGSQLPFPYSYINKFQEVLKLKD